MAGDGGMAITVTYPKETYFPIKFNGFDVGGLALTARVEPGETVAEVHSRLWAELKALVDEEFEDKLDAYVRRIRQADAAVEDKAFKG